MPLPQRGSTDKALMMFTQSLLVNNPLVKFTFLYPTSVDIQPQTQVVGGVLWLKTVYTMAFPNGFK